MTRTLERGIWVGALILSVSITLLVGRSSEQEGEKISPTKSTRSQEFRVKGPSRPSYERTRVGAYEKKAEFAWSQAESADELADFLTEALEIPRDTERLQHITEMLDHVTPENWSTLWQAYIRQTMDDGRVQATEWILFMNRVGEVAGPEAIAYFELNGQPQQTFNRREVLKGWASKDPRSAIDWMESQKEGGANSSLWPSLVGSVSESDPSLAFDLLDTVPESYASSAAGSLFEGMVQSEGLAASQERLLSKIAEAEPSDISPAWRRYYQLLEERVGRMKWLSEEYVDMEARIPDLSELEPYFAENR